MDAMRRVERDFGKIPEDDRITVEKLPVLLERLSSAMQILRDYGVSLPESARLQETSLLLEKMAQDGSYPDGEEALARAADAIITARDMGDIADALDAPLTAQMAAELRRAASGALASEGGDQAPRQYQSQYWVGAIMHRGGLHPTVPISEGKSPDFFVCPNALRYGVEVKRPQSQSGAFEALRKARTQLGTGGGHGIVVMDLTECLDELGLVRFGGEDAIRSEGPRLFELFIDRVSGVVWDSDKLRHRPGFESVVGLWAFARGWQWDIEARVAPRLFEYQGFQRFCSTRGNVWCHVADGFFTLMMRGLKDGGFHVELAEQISREPITRPFFDAWNWTATH